MCGTGEDAKLQRELFNLVRHAVPTGHTVQLIFQQNSSLISVRSLALKLVRQYALIKAAMLGKNTCLRFAPAPTEVWQNHLLQ